MSCPSDGVKIIRASSQEEELFDLVYPYLENGWEMTYVDEDWVILIKKGDAHGSDHLF